MKATWQADVLRAAGLKVVEHDGWKERGHGDFHVLSHVVWHHDGSPVGPSPGVPDFMLRNWQTAAANAWVALDGTWHLLAAGVAYHAGRVLPGKPDNWTSLGIETDHTTGELWSGVVMLDSLRRGTAAYLKHLSRAESGLEFHKTICSPVGRKTDPDGLDLATERKAVHALLAPKVAPKPASVKPQEVEVKAHPVTFTTGHGGRGQTPFPDLAKVVNVTFDGDANTAAPTWSKSATHLNVFGARPDSTVKATVWTQV